MRWTILLTMLAIEARFKNKIILKKFSTTNTDTKGMRAKWEDAIAVFHQCALAEEAWGNGKPVKATVNQFKNKLNSIRLAYKKKRSQLLATGNRCTEKESSTDDDSNNLQPRQFPEMPVDYLAAQSDDDSSDASLSDASLSGSTKRHLTCDTLNVKPMYRDAIRTELAALWPRLCDVFSGNPGCTGEAIIESGIARSPDTSNYDTPDEEEAESETDSVDSPKEARNKAKANAKKHMQPKNRSSRPCNGLT
ncbi:hypothetical protein PR003_g27043 [Phytophthora rubi]|uniref:Uncharacterized protein n=1 Tax=Phytophthora rubi TaxID=129364 RepID=A0A6A3ICG6_9STRA|nr:hypothetical protein PR001_g24899 [Phytophthora rubi]KAE8984202.1 hypothetical protein PR002_g23020 [Phytophthora rubi]KAE9283748.1 hypothetical protein PR003_g27043 [Phytophthora rubi]